MSYILMVYFAYIFARLQMERPTTLKIYSVLAKQAQIYVWLIRCCYRDQTNFWLMKISCNFNFDKTAQSKHSMQCKKKSEAFLLKNDSKFLNHTELLCIVFKGFPQYFKPNCIQCGTVSISYQRAVCVCVCTLYWTI